jgi:hypothetical protein
MNSVLDNFLDELIDRKEKILNRVLKINFLRKLLNPEI